MSLIEHHTALLWAANNGSSAPVLPEKTIRCKFASGYTPAMGDTQTLVDAGENIWDIYKASDYWGGYLTTSGLFYNCTELLEVIGANTTGVTNMGCMFYNCTSLTAVPLFDTSRVTDMQSMFSMPSGCASLTSVPLFDTSRATNMAHMLSYCLSLTAVPLFNTSRVTDMSSMFNNCHNVQSGALALYQQASTQANPPSSHSSTFNNCGANTVTGAAELAQIPSSWGGTGA